MKKGPHGFTLIELLVVIAIIALLSSVILASLNGARGKARNAKRNEDMHQYQLALTLYYDKHGGYPKESSALTGWVCLGDYGGTQCWGSPLYDPDPLVDSAFREFIGLPAGDTVKGTSNSYKGYVYRCKTYAGSGACSAYEMKWYLEGPGLTCAIGAAASPSEGNTLCTSSGS